MKKITFFFILSLLSSGLYSQDSDRLRCGTDEVMKKYYRKFPKEKERHDAFNLELSKQIKSGKLRSSVSRKQIYEIPVVVHVVGDGSPVGSPGNKSDADIIAWINYTNDVFAGTSSSGMSSSSTILPVKFVLAKIAPNCSSTNGINRIDASGLPKYVSGGVNDDQPATAAVASDITALGMWDNSKYYNIYVVNSLSSNSGALNGYAYFPGGTLDYSFMADDASEVNKQTLAHEFGHALALYHPFEGYDENTGVCPVNTDCTLQGDFVCDTPPMVSLFHSSIPAVCQSGEINPCTSQLYAGEEKNIMTYTFCDRDRFTPGQVNRAIAQLLQYRQDLLTSPVGNSTPINNNVVLTSACEPTAILNSGNNARIGITSVKFGSINNNSKNYDASQNNFYENFTGNYCFGVSKTNIPLNSATKLTVAPGTLNNHVIKSYIDYNNDGQFNETTELVLNESGISSGSFATAFVTPPSNAVLNTPLRMRVIGDLNEINACDNPDYGQIEDYSVTIESQTLSVDTTKSNITEVTKVGSSVYARSNGKMVSLHVYDTSGRVLSVHTNIRKSEITIPLNVKDTIVVVKVILENGEIISQKMRF